MSVSSEQFFIGVLALLEVAMLILHGLFSTYAPTSNTLAHYPNFQDVHVMIFIGFGFLMSFLRKAGYSAVGFTLLISAFVLQWHPLTLAFFNALFGQSPSVAVYLDIDTLLLSDFCAGAVMITFGVLIGKVSVPQLLVIAVLEVVFYSINESLSMVLGIADIGGGMVIHAFGAIFGLACSFVLRGQKHSADASSVYHSDLFSMIGTVFLWLYWPSFNGALAEGAAQQRAIVNTVLSLTGSCCTAFLASSMLRKDYKLNMVDIQNATLAGGVAIGSSANMMFNPAVALAIGISAGFVSTLGFSVIQPKLERQIKLHDTCGVMNLHLMPSLMGAIYSSIITGFTSDLTYTPPEFAQIYSLASVKGRDLKTQAYYQVLFLAITIAIASISGILVGFFINYIYPLKRGFVDDEMWAVPETEIPYFFGDPAESKGISVIASSTA